MKKINYFLLILATFSFLVLTSYYILKHSQVARSYDEANRICLGLGFYDTLFKNTDTPAIKRLNALLILDKGQSHPHFFEFVEATSFRLLEAIGIRGEEPMVIVTNAVFLLILLLSVYGIGSIVYSQKVGFLAALLVSTFPLVFAHSRAAMLDFPLMCMVSLSLLLLLKTKEFQSTPYSICSGIIFGLSLLTKEAAILFILPPFIYYFVRSYISGARRRVFLNFVITLAVFLIVASSVYLKIENKHVLKHYLSKILVNINQPAFFYFQGFTDCVGPLILILSLPLCFSYLVNLQKREKLFFFWFLFPIIMFSISPNRAIRFILPVLPAFGLIVVQEIYSNNLLRRHRKTYGLLLAFFSILQYLLFNYGALGYSEKRKNDLPMEIGNLSIKKEEYMPVVFAMLNFFKKENPGSEGFKKLLFLFNIGQIHGPLQCKFKVSHLPFYIDCPMEFDEVDFFFPEPRNSYSVFLSADYIIDKWGNAGGVHDYDYKMLDDLKRYLIQYKNHFRVIAEIKVFDGSSILIYKKIDH